VDFCLHILKSFGLTDFDIYLSTRPDKAIGDPEDWDRAEAGLATVLKNAGLDYQVDEGGGAFYGPKIDLKIRDAIGRSWQCSTIQFDFSLPERFDLSYIDSNGQQQRPFMIHRALLGAVERFFAVLIEHYSGKFPLWLAPIQVKVLPITDSFVEFGADVVAKLGQANIRAELDDRSEKVGAKIRDAEMMKVPYMFVVGAKEVEANSVSVRAHGQGDLGGRSIDEAIEMLKAEIASKGIEKNA
jgi:threonyl-tRNA synthetase